MLGPPAAAMPPRPQAKPKAQSFARRHGYDPHDGASGINSERREYSDAQDDVSWGPYRAEYNAGYDASDTTGRGSVGGRAVIGANANASESVGPVTRTVGANVGAGVEGSVGTMNRANISIGGGVEACAEASVNKCSRAIFSV